MPGGQAGNLTLTTPTLTISDGGRIFGTSDLTSGGNLLINADHLRLFNGSEISTSVFGDLTTQGGNVTLNSTNIVALNGSKVTAKAKQGKGGNILVNAEAFLHNAATTADVLNASSEVIGNDGTVQNNAPLSDISGSLTTLPARYLDAAVKISPKCGFDDPEKRSHFFIKGRSGFLPDPADPVPATIKPCKPAPSPVTATQPPPVALVESSGFGDR